MLNTILQQCVAQDVTLLVLPELRVPPTFLQTIQTFLRQQRWEALLQGQGLVLVVAGSWHTQQDDGRWVNRSYVLDARGDIVWAHDKLAAYEITSDNVQQNLTLKTQLGLNDHGGEEMIEIGDTLQFCDCALGRLAVAICAGFFHDPIADVLKASGATLFLVPAMSHDVRPLAERARTLVRSQHATTFVANCGTVAFDPHNGQINEQSACFYLLPAAGATPAWLPDPASTGQYLHVYTLQ